MKRYASHFLFISEHGYLKQHVVEVESGFAVRIFPLTEEIEDAEWLPGAIVLIAQDELNELDLFFTQPNRKQEYCKTNDEFYSSYNLLPVYFPQFDITKMQPACGTRHRLLR